MTGDAPLFVEKRTTSEILTGLAAYGLVGLVVLGAGLAAGFFTGLHLRGTGTDPALSRFWARAISLGILLPTFAYMFFDFRRRAVSEVRIHDDRIESRSGRRRSRWPFHRIAAIQVRDARHEEGVRLVVRSDDGRGIELAGLATTQEWTTALRQHVVPAMLPDVLARLDRAGGALFPEPHGARLQLRATGAIASTTGLALVAVAILALGLPATKPAQPLGEIFAGGLGVAGTGLVLFRRARAMARHGLAATTRGLAGALGRDEPIPWSRLSRVEAGEYGLEFHGDGYPSVKIGREAENFVFLLPLVRSKAPWARIVDRTGDA